MVDKSRDKPSPRQRLRTSIRSSSDTSMVIETIHLGSMYLNLDVHVEIKVAVNLCQNQKRLAIRNANIESDELCYKLQTLIIQDS